MEIILTISDDKKEKVLDNIASLFAIPKDQNEKERFTKEEWLKELLRKFIIQNVARAEQIEAQKAVAFILDDSLVS